MQSRVTKEGVSLPDITKESKIRPLVSDFENLVSRDQGTLYVPIYYGGPTVNVDLEANAVYLQFSEKKIAKTVKSGALVLVDLDD